MATDIFDRRPEPRATRLRLPVEFRPVLMINGLLVATLGVVMLVPALVDLYYDNPDWVVFVASALFTVFVGIAMWASARRAAIHLTVRQAFLLTASAWAVLAAFAALPLYFAEMGLSFPQAYFESMSGLTTTGATVVVGLDRAPPGFLIWRAILQWIGGVGIIVIAIAVLPALQVGGMQLFRTESSDRSEKILPRAGQTAGWILGIYLTLTLACAVSYSLAGMGAFDAVAHAMTTLATGGFSTRDASIGAFDSAAIESVAIVFMLLGALPFMVYFRALRTGPRALGADPQVRLFLAAVALFFVLVAAYMQSRDLAAGVDGLRWALFNVTTIITTTGYAAVDYTHWGPVHDVLIFTLMFLGGCTGSTAGGIKMFRIHVIGQTIKQTLSRVVYPSGVFIMRYGDRRMGDDVAAAVLTFLFLYIAGFLVVGLALELMGRPVIPSFSAAISLYGNIGPGLGPEIGPAGNYSLFQTPALWIGSFGMLLGRLELFTVLVLLLPRFWRA